MKVIFLGTPSFSQVVLDRIYNSRHEVVCVVTQPDKVNGRNKKIIFSQVKDYALEKGIPVMQYQNISKEGESYLRSLDADIMVTAAYGQILRQNILDICPHGIINVHASLLPKYRGSSPVQWALINGEKTVGVTIMQTEIGIDTGDIITASSITLSGDENTDETLEKLSLVGSDAIIVALDAIEQGNAKFVSQDENLATHCKMLSKADGLIDFNQKNVDVVNFVRGVTPWPSAFCDSENGVLKFIKISACDYDGNEKPGTILYASPKEGLVIACKLGAIVVEKIQGANAKVMDTKSYLLGKKLTVGGILSGK
ncbi:MAG: methionyl-tRNA formyltransferase [Clostridia bacterium]